MPEQMRARIIGKRVAWGSLFLCVVLFLYGLVFLPRTLLGFVLVFGSGIIALECGVIIKQVAGSNFPFLTPSATVPKRQNKGSGIDAAKDEKGIAIDYLSILRSEIITCTFLFIFCAVVSIFVIKFKIIDRSELPLVLAFTIIAPIVYLTRAIADSRRDILSHRQPTEVTEVKEHIKSNTESEKTNSRAVEAVENDQF